MKIRSPTITPTAVPGIIRVSTNSRGHAEDPDQQAGHQDHVADVVEHQAEEGVQVASVQPVVAVPDRQVVGPMRMLTSSNPCPSKIV